MGINIIFAPNSQGVQMENTENKFKEMVKDSNLQVEFQQKMLSWFYEHRREMPWREEPLPYYIWISEIMLQQTRVDTVIPYFLRFIRKYPDIASLAESDEEELLKYWEGLGYYQRVRNLRVTAMSLMLNHGGRLPETFSELLKLKGIGEYTAGAIASEAFAERVPAVDGNVFRVMARLTGERGDIRDRKVMEKLKDMARMLLPYEHVGDFNQALIELGALICIPKGTPKCGICPVKNHCEAYERGIQSEIPLRGKNKDRKIEERTVFLLECHGRYAIRKREEGKLLGGLYEIPHEEGFYGEEEVEELMKSHGLKVLSMEMLKDRKFLFTHIEWKLKGFKITLAAETADYVFETPERIMENYTLATAFKGYITELMRPSQQSFL